MQEIAKTQPQLRERKLDRKKAQRDALRALENPELANIPIIAMTANAFAEDCKQAFEAGMNRHVAKPIDVQNLLQVLSDVLN